MHDLTPITALGATAPRVDTHGGVTCTEVPEVALASFTARLGAQDTARTALSDVLGSDAPDVGLSSQGTVAALWTGPDQWLVMAPYNTHADLAQTLVDAATGNASVTDQTDAWVRFDLDGAGVLAVLELLCAADTRAMEPGAVTRSAIHHLGCLVHRRNTDGFSVFGPRASATSLHHAIVTALHAAL